MTITNQTTRRNDYTGVTGAETVFPYQFLIFASSDAAVYQDGSRLSDGTHYSVSGVGQETGGNVTLVVALPVGSTLSILSAVPAIQPTHFSEGTRFPAAVVEQALDRLTAVYQQGLVEQARALRLAVLSTYEDLTVPDPVALRGLRWKSDLSGLENIDLTTVLSASATLPLAVAQGGSGATTALAARVAYGVDGQVRKVLTNLTGGALAAGDLVALDTAADSTVVLGDTVSSKGQFVIALATIAHAATGEFLLSGIGPLNVTGTITRGRYLRKSATTLVAEDTGTLHGAATDPPQGALAVALTGGTTQITVRFFGFTYPGNTAPTITGLSGVTGLTGANNTGTPDTQYDLAATAAVVRDPVGGGIVVLPAVATRTLNLATPGPAEGGRDQVSAFSANTWIYAYLIAKTDGTYHVTASLTPPPTGPAFPTDYTLWAYLGALRINNGSAIIRTRLRGAWAWYDAAQVALTDGRATVETTVSVSGLVPPGALAWKALVTGLSQRNSNQYPTLRVVTGTDYDLVGGAGVGTNFLREEITWPNVSQQFVYLYAADPTATYGLHAYVRGYENAI